MTKREALRILADRRLTFADEEQIRAVERLRRQGEIAVRLGPPCENCEGKGVTKSLGKCRECGGIEYPRLDAMGCEELGNMLERMGVDS